MADGGYGREMDMMRIRENGSLSEQPVEAGVVIGTEPSQVVVAELIDHNRQNKLRPFGSAYISRNQGRKNQGEGNSADALHSTVTMFHEDDTSGCDFLEINSRVTKGRSGFEAHLREPARRVGGRKDYR
jgi:hypothetical protein